MSRYRFAAAWVSSLVATSLLAAPPPEDLMTKTDEHDGLKLTVKLKAESPAGSPRTLHILLKNDGQAAVSYSSISQYRNSKITVHDAAGKLVPFTRFGMIVIKNAEEFGGKDNIKQLAPGAETEDDFDLARVFDLTVAGDYTLSVQRSVNDHGPGKGGLLKVEKIAFKIVEPMK